MSTKVYDAWRLKRGVPLWPTLWDFQAKAQKHIRRILEILFVKKYEDDAGLDGVLLTEKMTPKYNPEPTPSPFFLSMYVDRQYRNQLNSRHKEFWDFTALMAIHEHRGRFYLRCFASGLVGGAWDFLGKDKRVEDFHYQNQTDRPKEISEKAWAARDEIWSHMVYDERVIQHVTLHACDPDMFGRLCMDTLGRYTKTGKMKNNPRIEAAWKTAQKRRKGRPWPTSTPTTPSSTSASSPASGSPDSPSATSSGPPAPASTAPSSPAPESSPSPPSPEPS